MNCFSEANLGCIHVGLSAAAEGESETEAEHQDESDSRRSVSDLASHLTSSSRSAHTA